MTISYDANNLDQQLKDFFRHGDKGKHLLPKNPFNILWMLENYSKETDSEWEKQDREHFIKFIKKNPNHEVNLGSDSTIKKIVTDDELIIKRMELLVEAGGSVEKLGISMTRAKSLPILKKAVELGLDVNFYQDGNYPLRNACKRRSFLLAEYLWSLPQINKNLIDSEGKNIAQIAIESRAYSFMYKIWMDKPDLFSVLNNAGQNCITLMINSIDFEKGSPKNIKLIKKIIIELIDAIDKKELILSENVISNILSNPIGKQLWSEANYLKLNEKLETNTIKTKKFKI